MLKGSFESSLNIPKHKEPPKLIRKVGKNEMGNWWITSERKIDLAGKIGIYIYMRMHNADKH